VRFAKRELTNEVRRNVGVAGFGEVAVRGAPDESCVARGVEPPAHLTSRDDLDRLLLVLLLLLMLSAPTATAAAALSAPPASRVRSAPPSFRGLGESPPAAPALILAIAVHVLVVLTAASTALRAARVSGPTAASSTAATARLVAASIRG